MRQEQELLTLISTLMRAMLISERTPQDYQHVVPYSPLDFHTLNLLRLKPGLRAGYLCEAMDVAPTTVSSLIARMQKRGWVVKERSKTDGRAISLFLTEKGEQIANTIHKQDIKNMALFLSELDTNEAKELIRLLGKVAGTVEKLSKTNG